MAEQATIRVLVIDDHPWTRSGLEALLATQPDLEVIAAAETGQEGMDLARLLRPDVVLAGLRLPDLDGCEVTRVILAGLPSAKVILFSALGHAGDPERFRQVGAHAFLWKETLRRTVADAIRAVHAGENLLGC